MSQTPGFVHIWLRDETKPFERRTALTPAHAARLVQAGFRVTVESSEVRCFSDGEYQRAHCTLAAAGSWRSAPRDALILGLKELPEEETPLVHSHIFFAHVYKGQSGWQKTISRFKQGGGTLLDMEFLVDDSGRRVAAFGRWAGYAGAALALDIWSHQQTQGEKPFPRVTLVRSKEELLAGLRERYASAVKAKGRTPQVIVMGAKGRCGTGATALLHDMELPTAQMSLWDKEETAAGGPFPEILTHDVFVNCVYVQGEMKPFLTKELIAGPRMLRVISDVSCDPSSPHNPLPIYERTTTFADPAVRLSSAPLLDLTAIDHLPSLLPRESSEDYGEQLLPHLLGLPEASAVWGRAAALYQAFADQV